MWTRRSVIEGLAMLPVGGGSAVADEPAPSPPSVRAPPPLTTADQVINVMDFEPLARAALPPAHFGYLASGVDDDRTVARNHEAFSQYEIRARRFNDLTHLDTSLTLLGSTLASPIYLSAVSAMRAFHPEGELAVARAARARRTQLMLSTGTTMPLEAVLEARGAPLWQQLYPTNEWAVTEGIVRHAERAGCTAIALTVDSRGARNNETLKRAMRIDARECVACHPGNSHEMWRRGPLFTGLDVSHVDALAPPDQSRAFLAKIRALVKTRLIIKGVVTGEDAAMAVEAGADAVVVSNHGGRNEETLRATVDCLPEVLSAVRGRIPVLLDGGIRRGTDVFKALALGARAVGIGRPQAWGLAAFGQPGVEAVIDILNRELLAIMRQAGTASLAAITPQYLVRSA
jgi:isopentenyl diphosphate isomerase/L-lactate dehydrogenase-like FMN-dependent dehydrogenase